MDLVIIDETVNSEKIITESIISIMRYLNKNRREKCEGDQG